MAIALSCCCHGDTADLVWCVGACITLQSMLVQTVLQFITIAVVMPPTLVVLIVAAFFFYQTQKYYRPASRDMQVRHVTRRCCHVGPRANAANETACFASAWRPSPTHRCTRT